MTVTVRILEKPALCSKVLPSRQTLIVLAVASAAFLGTIVSPPSLMDDVDATYSQIARTMLESGDWVTSRLNGVLYFDKPPGQVWAIALSFAVFGVHDWAARVPMALASILLCWLAHGLARWAFDREAGLVAGVGLATCVGMFLFTRVRIPDVFVACTTLLAVWSFLAAIEQDRRRRYAVSAGVSIGIGLLFKGLIAVVLPVGAIGLYLVSTGEWRSPDTWRKLNLPLVVLAACAIAAPWHIIIALRHPPYLDFSLVSEPGQYRGFFWRYFINEHLLRYLGLRYPRDYNTVPLLSFWLTHLVWFFPWICFAPAAAKRDFRAVDRASRARRMMLCWFAFTLLFFSASTSQEYYTLPAYAAVLVLIGDAVTGSDRWSRHGAQLAAALCAAAMIAIVAISATVWHLPGEGDISAALTQNPDAYTLSLGHMQDLTLESFAYLRGPLLLAGLAMLIGSVGGLAARRHTSIAALAVAMIVFGQAARWAMVAFDPYLSSRPLAAAIEDAPGLLVLDHEYYAFSSLVFYTNRPVKLLNGRKNNIEYGSNAPGAPDVFLDDEQLVELWSAGRRVYLATFEEDVERFGELLTPLPKVAVSLGGKVLLSN